MYTDEEEIKKSLALYLDEENKKNAEIRARTAEIEKSLKAAEEKENRIKEMYLAGSVVGDNVAFWYAELSAARSSRASLEKQLELATKPPFFDINEMMPALVQAAAEWSRRILDGSASFETRHRLIMSMVKDIQCTDRKEKDIQFRMSLVMPSSQHWQPRQDSNLD